MTQAQQAQLGGGSGEALHEIVNLWLGALCVVDAGLDALCAVCSCSCVYARIYLRGAPRDCQPGVGF